VPSDDCTSSDREPVGAELPGNGFMEPSHYWQLTARDWQVVDSFADQCTNFHPIVDKSEKEILVMDVPRTPHNLFLALFPPEHRLDRWVQHAKQSGRRSLSNSPRQCS
jgi:hypothetical protein